jgi:hypothetical protein
MKEMHGVYVAEPGDDDYIDFDTLPHAHTVRVFFCGRAHCSRPHVLLSNELGEAFAHFVVPDPLPDHGFIHDLLHALGVSAEMRGVENPVTKQ